MNWWESCWGPAIEWGSPAGLTLLKLIEELPNDGSVLLNVFGSSPLQLGVDANFLSGDVDIFSAN